MAWATLFCSFVLGCGQFGCVISGRREVQLAKNPRLVGRLQHHRWGISSPPSRFLAFNCFIDSLDHLIVVPSHWPSLIPIDSFIGKFGTCSFGDQDLREIMGKTCREVFCHKGRFCFNQVPFAPGSTPVAASPSSLSSACNQPQLTAVSQLRAR